MWQHLLDANYLRQNKRDDFMHWSGNFYYLLDIQDDCDTKEDVNGGKIEDNEDWKKLKSKN